MLFLSAIHVPLEILLWTCRVHKTQVENAWCPEWSTDERSGERRGTCQHSNSNSNSNFLGGACTPAGYWTARLSWRSLEPWWNWKMARQQDWTGFQVKYGMTVCHPKGPPGLGKLGYPLWLTGLSWWPPISLVTGLIPWHGKLVPPLA